MPKRMVAFDLVGTLIKSEAFHDARKNLHLDFNQEWDEAEDDAKFSYCFDYEAVFRSWLKAAAPRVLHQQFRDYLVTRVTDYLYPETCQTLKELYERGITLGFVTDGSDDVEGEMIRRILHESGIPPRECIIVTGERTKKLKKEGAPFTELIGLARQHGIGGDHIVFVGDKPQADIDGPEKAGIQLDNAILIVRDTRLSHPHKIENLREILSIPQAVMTNEVGG